MIETGKGLGVVPLVIVAAFLGSAYLTAYKIDETRKLLHEKNRLGVSVLEKAADEDRRLDVNEAIKLARELGCDSLIDEQKQLNYHFTDFKDVYDPFVLENGSKVICQFEEERLRRYLSL